MHQDLIYDVGLNNGDDTAFYLAAGYRVVAIEADPTLVDKARTRFAKEIAAGSLTILGVGIAEKEGTAEFWICEELPEWNSFDRAVASRDGRKHHSIMIPTMPFSSILRKHGVPHYLKIDIEGADGLCLAGLTPGNLPRFLSTESECVGSENHSGSESGLASLRLLHQLGYRKFKLVDQAILSSPTPRAIWQLDRAGRFGLRFVGRIPFLTPLVSWMTYRWRLERRFNRSFPMGSSGPFGDDAPGTWMTLEQAGSAYVEHRRQHFKRPETAPHTFWCDWHASL